MDEDDDDDDRVPWETTSVMTLLFQMDFISCSRVNILYILLHGPAAVYPLSSSVCLLNLFPVSRKRKEMTNGSKNHRNKCLKINDVCL